MASPAAEQRAIAQKKSNPKFLRPREPAVEATKGTNAGLTNATVHWSEPMRPLAQTDGYDAPRLIDELVPGEAGVIDDVVVE